MECRILLIRYIDAHGQLEQYSVKGFECLASMSRSYRIQLRARWWWGDILGQVGLDLEDTRL